jgi:hypothetical protein
MAIIRAVAERRFDDRWGRLVAAGTAAGFAVAAVALIAQIFTGVEALRSFQWPALAAGGSQVAALAILTAAGAVVHPAALLGVAFSGLAYALGGFDSESVWAPLVFFAIVAVAVAYWRLGGGIRALSTVRLVVLSLSVVAMLAGVIALQAPTKNLLWYRIRLANGRVQTQTFLSEGGCGVETAKAENQIDEGCESIIPARRARFVIGYSAAAVVLGIAAVAGAPRTRKLEPALG